MRQYPSGLRQVGVALLAAMVLMVVGILLTGALATTVHTKARTSTQFQQSSQVGYIADAAANRAFAEVVSQLDTTGNGLGAMGCRDAGPVHRQWRQCRRRVPHYRTTGRDD